ncbi:hypothetical protein [Alkalibacillus salilacus]|uniref:DUF4830 domain-containing protein n=1 Tax=Alkalibacillus salilacus TaxID=284582 RepID=A0ABT9VF90_9BACI|nr:hypothetical protein [Alkalibacillus salilacus]MDQ0159601.1 hypothetical protein [Alkalibacillus salilacus]
MQKLKIVILLIPFFLIMACGQENLNLNDTVTTIEIREWNQDEVVKTIEDEAFIEDLISELDQAETESTATMDYPLPGYELRFKQEDDIVFTIGYYRDLITLGIEGRYLDVEQDKMYGVERELSVE